MEVKFYNDQLKQRYLRYKSNECLALDHIETAFRKTADFERQLDKDASCWTANEIIEFYKMCNSVNSTSLYNLNSILSLYTQFCLLNTLVPDNQNHFLEVTYELIDRCVNKAASNRLIIPEETIYNWLKLLPNARDKYIILASYEIGISKDYHDIVYARPQDVDREHNIIHLDNRDAHISDKLIAVIDGCLEETECIPISRRAQRQLKLIDSGYILKEYYNTSGDISDFRKGRNIYAHFKRIINYLGEYEKINLNNVATSGMIHYLRRRLTEENLTLEQFLSIPRLVFELENQYNIKIVKSQFIFKYKDYLNA